MRALKEPMSETTPTHTFTKPKTILRRCWATSKAFTITVEEADYADWLNPDSLKPIEICMPYLTREERDLMLSGLSEIGYESVLGYGFEEEDTNDSGD